MAPVLVVVHWDDAWADTEGFDTLHAIEKTHRPMKIQTVGWLLHEDEIGVSLANEISTDNEGTTTYRGRTFVPRGMIEKVEPVIKPRKPRKPPVPPAHKDPV